MTATSETGSPKSLPACRAVIHSVIARNSTLRYRGREKDLRQIASELDVRYVLDGSVQRQATRLRITTELTDVVTNREIWAERFEGY